MFFLRQGAFCGKLSLWRVNGKSTLWFRDMWPEYGTDLGASMVGSMRVSFWWLTNRMSAAVGRRYTDESLVSEIHG